MTKFKIGDRVNIPESCEDNFQHGYTTGKVIRIAGGVQVRADGSGLICYGHNYTLITPAPKTFDTLEVGDKVLDDKGDTCTVLAVLPNLIGLSNYDKDKQNYFMDWYTPLELKDKGWNIVGARSKADDIIEVTLEEVAKLKSVAVERIRIVEGSNERN